MAVLLFLDDLYDLDVTTCYNLVSELLWRPNWSQVEITVMLSQTSGNLRNLIEGNKIRGIPAPPSQSLGPYCA